MAHDIQSTVAHNQALEREIEGLRHSIAEGQEVRHQQQNSIYQNNAALQKWEQECFAQSSRISVLDKERCALIERIQHMTENLHHLTKQTEDVSASINQAQTDITKLKSMIHGLDLEINNLESANGLLVEEQKQKLAKNSQEYNLAHELTSQL